MIGLPHSLCFKCKWCKGYYNCDAFPNGIPREIFNDKKVHIRHIKSDKHYVFNEIEKDRNTLHFSKIEFRYFESIIRERYRIILDFDLKELSYQEIDYKRNVPNAIIRKDNEEIKVPLRYVKNCSTGFKRQLTTEEWADEYVSFSYGHKLSDKEIEELLPLCEVNDYLRYNWSKAFQDSPSYWSYGDGINVHFKGITNSYIPIIELPLHYSYDDDDIWPTERLFRFLKDTYFSGTKFQKRRI